MSTTSAVSRTKRRAETQPASDETSVPKRRKRQSNKDVVDGVRAAPKPRKNAKCGRLALLLQMPVDVFYEIARNLTPKEILTLARSTKSWRKLLTSRESVPIWRAARENVGLPECPDDLSEPEYADLVYGRGCMLCDSGMARNVYFAFRLRLCKKCFQNNAGIGVSLVSSLSPFLIRDTRDNEIYTLAPSQFVYGAGRGFPMQIECGLVWFWKKEFVKTFEKYIGLHGEEKEKFVKERKERAEKINAHARLIEQWVRDQEKQKRKEKKAIGLRRRDEIYSRLKELGYTDKEINIHCGERWHILTRGPKPLTSRIWNNIRPELERIIEQEKNVECECREGVSGSSSSEEDDDPSEALPDAFY